ncbi:hypothetical protein PHLCEN_2v1346 [Hermanssonia centrifuga]|uniref:Uncharacterized protein n=1 Tax=Hermanssonia centrifuga TaxID=98765 RepID=A0A2R6S3F4_9APHY|nr:hypothetical protein PHLCEN_2v1346 [Hermanssonia centrifuga]
MRATTIISTFCVLACTIYSPASALPSNSGSLAARAPSPSIVARAPQPSSARRMEARAPMPSASLKKKREQHVIVSAEEQISRQLCPTPMSVCPITSARPSTLLGWIADGYECVDQQEDLTSCGGCGIVDTK